MGRCVRRLTVPIYKSDGSPYTATDGNAILIYAKARTTEISGSFPTSHWEEDGLVGGSFSASKMSHAGRGIWVRDMDSDALEEDRSDYYFVKTGTANTYGLPATWSYVSGCDPISFGTLTIPPAAIKNMLEFLSEMSDMPWGVLHAMINSGKIPRDYVADDVVDEIEASTAELSGISPEELAARVISQEDVLNAIANRLRTSNALAEKIASLI
jgi:hypothetical protein